MSARDDLRAVTAVKQAAAADLEAAGLELAAVDARLVELDGLEAAAALGEVDAAGLAAERSACLGRRKVAVELTRRLRAVLDGVGPRIERALVEVARDDVKGVGRELGRLLPARRKAEEKLQGALRAADQAGSELVKQRQQAAELLKDAAAIAASVEEPDQAIMLPVEDDEGWSLPDGWDGRAGGPVLAAILAGPRTPGKDAARAAEARARQDAESDRGLVSWAARELLTGNRSGALSRAPERLHAEVEETARRMHADVEAQRQALEEESARQLAAAGFAPRPEPAAEVELAELVERKAVSS